MGSIAGTLAFNIAGSANDCATIFSGRAFPAPTHGKITMNWSSPSGSNPTKWTQTPNFKVTGGSSMGYIDIEKAKVTGSFTPFASPWATLSGMSWGGSRGAATIGCASSTGLYSLTLGTPPAGRW